jgi:large subunit ribosomal protein L24
MKLKKGDNVVVIYGKDAGKSGEVKQVLPRDNKVVVTGVNVAKRHAARRSEKDAGGIKSIEMPISASSVMLLHKGKPTRVGYKVKDGKKVRIARTTGDEI